MQVTMNEINSYKLASSGNVVDWELSNMVASL
jgi:hypothetical protein